MPVLVTFLRGINVGGHAIVKMDALRALFVALKFQDPQTYVQSGNIVFKTSQHNLPAIAVTIQRAVEKKFACRPEVILRTVEDLRVVVAKNPFAKRPDIEPGKLLVSFLADAPAKDAPEKLRLMAISPEELHLVNREIYIYFPSGMGKSKLPWSRMDKVLKTPGTGRNWNSVQAILAMAEKLQAQK
jgi:uncharacterized protein (DUF1697 family)